MLKKTGQWFLIYGVVLPLLLLALPLVYVAAAVMAILLPPVLAIALVFEDRQEYKIKTLRDGLYKFSLAVVVLPLFLLATIAPLRSMILFVFSFFPGLLNKFRELHLPISDLLVPLVGDLAPYWLDFYWGIYGVISLFIFALLDSYRRNMLVRQVEILPTSKIQSAAIGLVELTGKALPTDTEPDGALIRNYLHSTADGHSMRTEACPFYLDDGTGRVLIDPQDCDVSADTSYFEIKLHHAILKTYQPEHGYPESRLMPGEEVYVLGNMQIIEDDEYSEIAPDAKVVIRPQKTSLLHPHFYDLFFLSNTSEEELLALFKKSIHRGWLWKTMVMAITGWMTIYAWNNITQFEQMDLDAPPALFRLVSTPTTLEQTLDIDGLGTISNFDALERLRAGDKAGSGIMRALKKKELAQIAIPALLENARAIDHPGFGLAWSWLGKLDALPRGARGTEYYYEKEDYRDETLVYRVLLELDDDGLFASFRANFGSPMTRTYELRKRYVVFEFTSKATGEEYTRRIFARDGYNAVDKLEVFDYFLPGEYSFDMYARREYAGGAKDRGSRKRKPYDLELW